jgi:hypothetical protein
MCSDVSAAYPFCVHVPVPNPLHRLQRCLGPGSLDVDLLTRKHAYLHRQRVCLAAEDVVWHAVHVVQLSRCCNQTWFLGWALDVRALLLPYSQRVMQCVRCAASLVCLLLSCYVLAVLSCKHLACTHGQALLLPSWLSLLGAAPLWCMCACTRYMPTCMHAVTSGLDVSCSIVYAAVHTQYDLVCPVCGCCVVDVVNCTGPAGRCVQQRWPQMWRCVVAWPLDMLAAFCVGDTRPMAILCHSVCSNCQRLRAVVEATCSW